MTTKEYTLDELDQMGVPDDRGALGPDAEPEDEAFHCSISSTSLRGPGPMPGLPLRKSTNEDQ